MLKAIQFIKSKYYEGIGSRRNPTREREKVEERVERAAYEKLTGAGKYALRQLLFSALSATIKYPWGPHSLQLASGVTINLDPIKTSCN